MLISVIIPTFNGGGRITKLLDSLLTEANEDLEIIVVDDHSEDDTEEVVGRYKDRNVLFLEKEGDRNPATSRRQGVKIARGEYVINMDDDDYVEDGYIKAVMAAIEENGHPDRLATRVKIVQEDGSWAYDGEREDWLFGDDAKKDPLAKAKAALSERFGLWRHLYRKQYLLDHGMDNYPDFELALYCFQFNDDCRSVYVAGATYCYVQRKSSLSHDITKSVNLNAGYGPPAPTTLCIADKRKERLILMYQFRASVIPLILYGVHSSTYKVVRKYLKQIKRAYGYSVGAYLKAAPYFSKRTRIVSLIILLHLYRPFWVYLYFKNRRAIKSRA